MVYKWKCSIVVLSVFFSSSALSDVCEMLFHKLDKQHVSIADDDHRKKIIQMENNLFDAIEKCKTYAGMFVLMGELQIEMGQIPLAVVYGKKSVELDNKYWRAHKLLGSAKMLTNEFENGLRSLNKAVELNPTNINTQLNLISALIQNKKYEQALKRVNTIIQKNEEGTLAIAYYFRSQIYQNQGLIIEANKDAKKSQEMGFSLEQR